MSPRLRTLLHHQGPGRGHGPRALHRLRHREAERRQHLRLQRARHGHDLQGLPAQVTEAGDGAGSRALGHGFARATRPYWWSRTRRRSGAGRPDPGELGYTVLTPARPTRPCRSLRKRGARRPAAHRRRAARSLQGNDLAAVSWPSARSARALHVRLHARRHRPRRASGRRRQLPGEAVRPSTLAVKLREMLDDSVR